MLFDSSDSEFDELNRPSPCYIYDPLLMMPTSILTVFLNFTPTIVTSKVKFYNLQVNNLKPGSTSIGAGYELLYDPPLANYK